MLCGAVKFAWSRLAGFIFGLQDETRGETDDRHATSLAADSEPTRSETEKQTLGLEGVPRARFGRKPIALDGFAFLFGSPRLQTLCYSREETLHGRRLILGGQLYLACSFNEGSVPYF